MPQRKAAAPPANASTLAALARAVRAARERRAWSVAALAQKSGLSKGMLLQIEAARTNPSIGSLIRIANAFGVSVWQLFAPPEDPVRVAPPQEALTLWRSARGGSATLLVGAATPQPVELWDWHLAPGDAYKADKHYDTTLEVLHVRRGTLTLVVGRTRVAVGAGASAIARMDQRHEYRNDGRGWLRMTMVVVDPAR
jgi:transcriptional regulator with XRE-family HTH domain